MDKSILVAEKVCMHIYIYNKYSFYNKKVNKILVSTEIAAKDASSSSVDINIASDPVEGTYLHMLIYIYNKYSFYNKKINKILFSTEIAAKNASSSSVDIHVASDSAEGMYSECMSTILI